MNNNLIEKVKDLFKKEKFAEGDVNKMVKTKDGDIFMVKGTELAIDAEIVKMDQEEEVAIADGDYILDDDSTISIKDGKISAIIPEAETVAEDKAEGGKEEMKAVKFAVIKQISKWSLDVDQDSIEVGTILTQTWEYEDGTKSEPCPVMSGEYELENGDLIQVDSDGKVVLITKKGTETVPAVEETPAPVDNTAEQMNALKAEFDKLKAENELIIKEAKETKEAFEKLRKQPAVKPIDTKKFEKIETSTDDFKIIKNENLSKVADLFQKYKK